jgi:two-component system, OmpR family, sensor histidine kinase BaeS
MTDWQARHSGAQRPPWWPADEPWPPRSSRFHYQRRRSRFVRRTGWYSFWPLWVVLWWLATLGRGRSFTPMGSVVVLLLAGAAAAATVAVILRRLAGPVADIVSAADRIAHRDYRVRIDEPAFAPAWVKDTARAFNAMAGQLHAQDEARRHLMADVAHELRTPLTVLQGKLEGLIDGVYPRDNERLQALLEDTRVFARIVEDLRTLANSESGALALAKEPTDIVVLANDAAASLASEANERGVTLGVAADRAGDIEPVAVDPVRIREVLVNLITNALRYTPRGGRVEVKIGATPHGVELRVVDTGPGIAEAELPRIFDRFYKGAGSTGSGLGLTIARNLVEAHGGTIRAESRPGAGTTMIFSLPRT